MSLLSPGRGLRGARLGALPRLAGDGRWAVAGRIDGTDIGTGAAPDSAERRVFRIDGVAPRNQAEIAARIATIWLTPQMDRLFEESASGRRRFLDRLVWTLEPGHAREVAAHDTAMAGRNRLLAAGGADPVWLAGLEDAMARHAVAVAAARTDLAIRLNTVLAGGAAGRFPAAQLLVLDAIADRLAADPAVAVEDWVRARLADNRARDAAAGRAALGAHRGHMGLQDAQTGQDAAFASTGQQKSMLIALILGHAALIAAARGTAPILLLDEPAVHLDEDRRAALFDALAALAAQVLITGTDSTLFAPLHGVAEGLVAGGGALHADPRFPVPNPVITPHGGL